MCWTPSLNLIFDVGRCHEWNWKGLKLMIPRGTRTRPILEIPLKDGVLVYLNNVNSPEKPLHPCFFTIRQSDFRIHAVSCHVMRPEQIIKNFRGSQINLRGVIVEFWSCKDEIMKPLLTIDIYVPHSWTLRQFLDEIGESVDDLRVISLMYGFVFRGIKFPFNTMNSIHERFK